MANFFSDPEPLSALGGKCCRQSLRELGYSEGKSLVYESRSAEGKLERFQALTDELIRLKVDVLVASSTTEALAFKNATKTIPIVFVVSSDPISDGLVDSLARPGGNLTGVTTIASVLAGKRLELLKETVANLSRVAVLWNPREPGSVQQWKESQLAAQALNCSCTPWNSAARRDLPAYLMRPLKRVAARSLRCRARWRLPTEESSRTWRQSTGCQAIFEREDYVTSGGLMSYGADRAASYKRAAVMVDKILKGTMPRRPAQSRRPMKFEFVVRLGNSASSIRLTIPPNVLVRADRVIR